MFYFNYMKKGKNMFGWFKKKAGSIKDYGAEVTNTKEIKTTFDNIKDMANNNLNPYKVKEGKKETFEQAMSRFKTTESDLIAIYKNLVYGFYISLFFVITCILTTFYSLFIAKTFFGAFAGLGIALFCLANCFRFSFRAYQIRHRKLCDVKDWWDNSSEWLPKIKG